MNGKVQTTQLMTEFTSMEFPHINEQFLTKQHQYVYAVGTSHPGGDYFFPGQATIGKLDLLSNKMLTWGPVDFITVQEPRFVPSPGAEAEDDGIIICGGFNASSLRGIMIVLDAKTMTEIALVTAPQLTPYGLHNDFFSRDVLPFRAK